MRFDNAERGEPLVADKLYWAAGFRQSYFQNLSLPKLSDVPNYAQFTGQGDQHCVLPCATHRPY